jgi:hypothetical protein
MIKTRMVHDVVDDEANSKNGCKETNIMNL